MCGMVTHVVRQRCRTQPKTAGAERHKFEKRLPRKIDLIADEIILPVFGPGVFISHESFGKNLTRR